MFGLAFSSLEASYRTIDVFLLFLLFLSRFHSLFRSFFFSLSFFPVSSIQERKHLLVLIMIYVRISFVSQKRGDDLSNTLSALYASRYEMIISISCYDALRRSEEIALPERKRVCIPDLSYLLSFLFVVFSVFFSPMIRNIAVELRGNIGCNV